MAAIARISQEKINVFQCSRYITLHWPLNANASYAKNLWRNDDLATYCYLYTTIKNYWSI